MNSLNHYAYGSIAQWMYENMVGLTLIEPDFKRFRVKSEFTDKRIFAEVELVGETQILAAGEHFLST